jgi:transposase-like protein
MAKLHTLISYLGCRRWRVADARAVLDAQVASGLSVCQFARQQGLDPQRLHRWRHQLNGRGVAGTTFVELGHSALAAQPTQPIEVVLCSGRVLRVAESVDVIALKRLARALEERETC